MRIVLISSGQAARQFAVDLCGEYDVCVVHSGSEGRSQLEGLDVEVLEGLGNDADLLKRAGAADAAHVIACTRSDEMNILACLTARRLGNAETICFVSKEEYVQTFAGGDATGASGSPEMGIDHVIWPARMLADHIERILTVAGATDVGSFARGQIRLLEYRLPDGLPILNRPLAEIRSLPRGTLIVAITREDEWFVPRGQSVLKAGDRVHFWGRAQSMHHLAAWFKEHLGGESDSGEVVIIGGGTVGAELAKSLERDTDQIIKIIENDGARCDVLAKELNRALVLHGNGCDVELLESEGVRFARTLVAVTDSDEKNLLASLLGQQLGVPKIVTRVSNSANRKVFETVGIDVPISARSTTMEAVLHMIRHKEVDLLAKLGEGGGEVLDVTLPETFAPAELKDLVLPPDSLVAAVVRRNKAMVPSGATMLTPGDHCLIVCKAERVSEALKAFLG